jgi:hydroxypyruvate isomerase
MQIDPLRSAGAEGNGGERACGRLRLAVAARNFGDVPIPTSLERVAKAGFDACDNFNWRDQREFGQFRKYLKEFGLVAGVLVVNKKPDVNALGCSLVLREDRAGFLEELRLCMEAAHAVGCSTLEVLSGNTLPGVPHETQMDNCVAALEAAVPLLAANGMTAVVELLNSNVDHPGYFLDRVEPAVQLIRRIAHPSVRLLFDIYHVQVIQGNLIRTIRNTFDCVGQYHFADVPGRHEPGTGEINFRNVFRAIYDLNYKGYVTAEYHPTDFTFRDLEAVRELATFQLSETTAGG